MTDEEERGAEYWAKLERALREQSRRTREVLEEDKDD